MDKTTIAKFQTHSFLLGFMLSAVFLLMVICFLPVHFDTNDDIGFILSLTGKDGFLPDEFSPYISHSLFAALKCLYQWAPSIQWWSVIIYLFEFVSLFLITSMLFRLNKYLKFWIAFPIVFYLFFYGLIYASFTHATLMLEFSAILCLLEILMLKEKPCINFHAYFGFLLVCLTASALFRWEIWLYLAPLGIVLFVYTNRSTIIYPIVFFAIALSILGIDRLWDNFSSSIEEKEFVSYNNARIAFTDTKAGADVGTVTDSAICRAGWDRIDYNSYRAWLIFNGDSFNYASLKIFLKNNNLRPIFLRMKIFARSVLGNLYREWKHIVLLALVLFLFLSIIYSIRKAIALPKLLYYSIPLIYTIGTIGFFLWFRFVPRMYIPIFLFLLISHLQAMVVFAKIEKNHSLSTKISKGISILLTVWVFCFVAISSFDLFRDKRNFRAVSNALCKVSSIEKIKYLVYAQPASGLLLETVPAFSMYSLPASLKLFPDGTLVHSPRYNRILASMHLSSGNNFLKALVSSDSFALVLITDSETESNRCLDLWSNYLHKCFPESVYSFSTVSDFKSGAKRIAFYRIVALRKSV